MSSSPESSRLSNYSIAAAAAAVASGGAAHADVFSGDLGLSFGRVGGNAFYNGFSTTNSSLTTAGITTGIGGLSIYFYAFQASTYADAAFSMSIEGFGSQAMFNQLYSSFSTSYSSTSVLVADMVDAGAFWQASSNSTSDVSNQIFWTTSSGTWTNPASGTKYVMFFLDGDEDDAWGWLQFDWNITDGDDWSVSLSNWAYSTDGPLAAGDSGSTPAVPGLGGLAALAVGAAGVRGRRQRSAG